MIFPGTRFYQPSPASRFLDSVEDDPLAKILTAIKSHDSEEQQRGILCKVCEHHITHPDELLTIGDKFIHCFTNPAVQKARCWRSRSDIHPEYIRYLSLTLS